MSNHVLCDYHQEIITTLAERLQSDMTQTIQVILYMAQIYQRKMRDEGKLDQLAREIVAEQIRTATKHIDNGGTIL